MCTSLVNTVVILCMYTEAGSESFKHGGNPVCVCTQRMCTSLVNTVVILGMYTEAGSESFKHCNNPVCVYRCCERVF